MRTDDITVPIRRPENLTAAYFADWMERSMHYTQDEILNRTGLMKYAHAQAAGEQLDSLIYFKDRALGEIMTSNLVYYATTLRWARSRIVYDVDKTIADSLLDMEANEVLPASVLRQVPHPSPLMVWPYGIPGESPDGYQSALRGMYITGHCEGRGLVEIHDPDATSILLVFCSDVYDGTQVKTVDTVRVHIPLQDTSVTLDQLVSDLLDDFVWEATMTGGSRRNKRRYLNDLLRVGLPHLFYACASNADIDDAEPSKVIAKGKNKGKPTTESVQVHPFGFRVGTTLRTASYTRSSSSEGSGDSRRPHWRKWHPHTYLYGKGKTLKKVKMMPPIFVQGSSGKKLDGTIIKID